MTNEQRTYSREEQEEARDSTMASLGWLTLAGALAIGLIYGAVKYGVDNFGGNPFDVPRTLESPLTQVEAGN